MFKSGLVLVLIFATLSPDLCQAARRRTNCGLNCYRYTKCMGYLDGGKRPGQLGDTGQIVLGHCSPLAKGCECELDVDTILKKEETSDEENTSEVQSKLYLERTTRKPRSINRSLYARKRLLRY